MDERRVIKSETVRVEPENLPEAIHRGTGPLDYLMPWIIKFRIAGTTEIIQVEVAERLIMGRSDVDSGTAVDVDLTDFDARLHGVSRLHVEIIARNSRITIRDLESANGSYLNEGRLVPGVEYRLRHGDRLMLGKLILQVLFVIIPSSYEKNNTEYSDVLIPKFGTGQPVLVVDDDDKARGMIEQVLTEAGFAVNVAINANQALTMYEAQSPEAIIMEWLLPDMSGLNVVKYVRDRDPDHHIPIIVMSGATAGYQLNQAVSAGADVCLTKPVGVDEVIKSVRDLMN